MPCRDCELWGKAKTNCMPIAGNLNSEIILIGEAPGKEEDDCGIPFIGKSGRLLRDALKVADVVDFAITNTCRCRPPNNRPPTQEEANACIHYFWEDLAKMDKLKLVIAIGNIALRTLTGKQSITKVSGEEWDLDTIMQGKIKLMPLMHPSYVLQNQDKELDRFYDHVRRIPLILSGKLSSDEDLGEYEVIKTMDQWEQYRDILLASKLFAYDIETTGLNPRDDSSYIKCIQFSNTLRKAVVLPLSPGYWSIEDAKLIVQALKLIFENKKIGKIGQNIKFDNLWMKTILGIDVRGTVWDTKIAEYLLYGKGSTGLKDMAWGYSRLGGYEKKLEDSPEKIDGENLWIYGGIDADLTWRIYQAQVPKVHRDVGTEHLLKTLLVPVSEVLMKMEYNGLRLDIDRVKQADVDCGELIDKLKKQMYALPEVKEFERAEETDFNPNSHKQVAYILFKICGLQPIKQTEKGGDSTDKEVLQSYVASSKLAALLLDYSGYEQMRKTFLKELLTHERQGRIHTTLWLTETSTGRTSSKKPNLQNMPKGDKDILELRKCFVADPGFLLCECDMNQHELRVMAEVANDETMKEALKGDIHRATAAAIFNVKPEDVTTDQRREAKTVNFGIIYGLTPYGLSQQLSIPEEQAELWIYRFFEKYFMTKRYMEMTSTLCQKQGYVSALSGRRRYFPSYEEFDVKKLKEAINFPIQCLPPEMRVLTTDLRWIPVGEVSVGTTLVGIDEHGSSLDKNYRKWRKATVTQMERKILPVYRIYLNDGTYLDSTAEHPWLVYNGTHYTWRNTESLQKNSRLPKVLNVWSEDISKEAGYLAGAFDSDGCLATFKEFHGTFANTLKFSQKDNVVFNKVRQYLGEKRFKFHWNESQHISNNQTYTWRDGRVLGGTPELLRFLGQIRPHRLLQNFDLEKLGRFFNKGRRFSRVLRIECLGEKEVIALETDCHTFMSEGYPTHNSLASDILLYNAIGVDRLLRGHKSFLCLEVHDSLLLNIHRDELGLIGEIRQVMTEYFKQFMPFESPLKVDVKVGEDWGSMEEWRD